MAISVLVEALLLSGEWIRNKLKALTSLLGRLGAKAAKALPGIIGVIIIWILNRAALYTYMVTK